MRLTRAPATTGQTTDRKQRGDYGEKLAAGFLKKHGYRIIEPNFRCRYGEVDLVTKKKDSVVFIEVRTRSSDAFGPPEASVTAAKLARLQATAEVYMTTHHDLPESWRIDFVAVELTPEGKVKRIEVIENALY